MRSAVIFAFVATALVAATVAAPPKASPRTGSSLLDQAIKTTRGVASSLAWASRSHAQLVEWYGDAPQYAEAQDWYSNYFVTAPVNILVAHIKALWFNETPEEIKETADEYIGYISGYLDEAAHELFENHGWETQLIVANWGIEAVVAGMGMTDAVAPLWEMVKGDAEGARQLTHNTQSIAALQTVLRHALKSNGNALQEFYPGLRATSVETLRGAIQALVNQMDAAGRLHQELQEMFPDNRLDITKGYDFANNHLFDLVDVIAVMTQEAYEGTDAEVEAAIDGAMSKMEAIWDNIISEYFELPSVSQVVAAAHTGLLLNYVHGVTAAMEPLTILLEEMISHLG